MYVKYYIMKLIFVLFGVVGSISGIVESCPGWKLADYPEVRQFLRGKNGVNLYPEIRVQWIHGHNPDLLINGEERIDLTKYKSKEELHTYLQSRGFTNVSPRFQFPRDKNENCRDWAQKGDCASNSMYMNEYCSYSCNKSELWRLESITTVWR